MAVAERRCRSAVFSRGSPWQYLVVEVARCGDCHTPLNDKGEPVTEKWLQGTVLLFKPTLAMPWADTAPNIAGLPGWSTSDAVTFFMTGKYKASDLYPTPWDPQLQKEYQEYLKQKLGK